MDLVLNRVIDRILNRILSFFATIRAFIAPEWGGVLFNYKNGELEEIARWETNEEMKQAHAILDTELDSGRDFVYVAVIKCGERKGYFATYSPAGVWARGYWPGLYEPMDAYRDAMKIAKAEAKRLGFQVGGNG